MSVRVRKLCLFLLFRQQKRYGRLEFCLFDVYCTDRVPLSRAFLDAGGIRDFCVAGAGDNIFNCAAV